MINSLFIEELFDEKGNNKKISFNKNLTILVGKNGSGKTTTLKIINNILNNEYKKLFNYKFKSIRLETTSGPIIIEKVNNKTIKLSSNEDTKPLTIRSNTDLENHINNKKSFTSLYFPTYRRIETDFLDLIYDNDFDKYEEKFIANRLIDKMGADNKGRNTVLGLTNNDISKIIEKKWNEVIEHEKTKLNNLIQKFFYSLLDTPKDLDDKKPFISFEFEENEVRNHLTQLFKQAGFIKNDTDIHRIESYVENVSQAHAALDKLSDSEYSMTPDIVKTLLSYEKVAQLVTMYRDTYSEIHSKKQKFHNLNKTLSNFLNKEVTIEDGRLLFVKNQNELSYEDLSAGEKQLVALFIYTHLSLDPGSIVIIDEPELSLHVSWQREFLQNLIKDNENIQFIVSTHSPFIISNYRDQIEELGSLGIED